MKPVLRGTRDRSENSDNMDRHGERLPVYPDSSGTIRARQIVPENITAIYVQIKEYFTGSLPGILTFTLRFHLLDTHYSLSSVLMVSTYNSCLVTCHTCHHEWTHIGNRYASLSGSRSPVRLHCPGCHGQVRVDVRNAKLILKFFSLPKQEKMKKNF